VSETTESQLERCLQIADAHDLRHAHASWLLAGGSDLRSVMDRMGHSLIQTTQKYLHPLPDIDQRNLDAFRRITDAPDPE
jgi:integrase